MKTIPHTVDNIDIEFYCKCGMLEMCSINKNFDPIKNHSCNYCNQEFVLSFNGGKGKVEIDE